MNLGLNEIFAVIDKVKSVGLESFEYSDVDMKIKIKSDGGKRISERDLSVLNEGQISDHVRDYTTGEKGISSVTSVVESPMVGTFYTAPSEGAEPFVSVGDKVKKGQVIGIIEAMKLMNEIEADTDGIVEEILVENENMVEFGQPLLRIRKE